MNVLGGYGESTYTSILFGVATRDIKEMNKLLSAIGQNINQIAKQVNAGGPTY
ncbi:MAG: hypothetical protein ACOX85_08220 [Candidatus Pararuminococcus gallinarum]